MYNIFSDVYSCALQRWATFANGKTAEERRRADDEKKTAYMALALAAKPPTSLQ